MLPAKGKYPTKGFQQILKENVETVNIYRNLTLGASLLRPLLSIAISGQLDLTGITMASILSNICIPIILICLLVVMIRRAMPLYNNLVELKLIDPGHDLGMPGGWGEHLKDAIAVLVLAHVLSITSPTFWYILLLLPLRALHLSWKYVIGPSFVSFLKSDDYPYDNQCGKKIKKNANKKKIKYLRTIKHWHHFR